MHSWHDHPLLPKPRRISVQCVSKPRLHYRDCLKADKFGGVGMVEQGEKVTVGPVCAGDRSVTSVIQNLRKRFG